MQFPLASVVRIRDRRTNPSVTVGVGFLVAKSTVVTCAHVVADALGRRSDEATPPSDSVAFDLPFVGDCPSGTARIDAWFPVREHPGATDPEDLAFLEILDASSPQFQNAIPAPLTSLADDDFFGRDVRVVGFPGGMDQGDFVEGRLQGPVATGWIQLDQAMGSRAVVQGFSGAPVWDKDEHVVVGLIVAAQSLYGSRPGVDPAYLIPVRNLLRARPELEQLARPVNPYLGFKSFGERDARFFFGRDIDAVELLKKVPQQRFSMLIGPSGIGKSSLVQAAISPSLLASGDWLVSLLRPQRDPFIEVSDVLAELFYTDPVERSRKATQIHDDLTSHRTSLSAFFATLVRGHSGKRILVAIDPLEELTRHTKAVAAEFLSALVAIDPTLPVHFLLCLRSDYLAAAQSILTKDSVAPLEQITTEGLVKFLGPLDIARLNQVIEGPAEALGVSFEPGLVRRMVDDLGDEPGEQLPLLEFTLMLLWEHMHGRLLTHRAYEKIGTAREALANHAAAFFEGLTDDERLAMRRAMLQLVSVSLRDVTTRRPAYADEVGPELWQNIARWADSRLVITKCREPHGESSYRDDYAELAHDSLLTQWPQLAHWIDENADLLAWRSRVSPQIKIWNGSGCDDAEILRGARLLEEAKDQKALRGDLLTQDEHHFIDASLGVAEAERNAQRLRRFITNSLAVAAFVLFCVATAGAIYAFRAQDQATLEAEKARKAEEVAKLEAEKANKSQEAAALEARSAKRSLARLRVAGGDDADARGDVASAAIYYTAANLGGIDDLRIPFGLTRNLSRLKSFTNTLQGHGDAILDLAYSPDGRWLLSGGRDGVAFLHRAPFAEKIISVDAFGAVDTLAFSPDSRFAAIGSRDWTVRLISLDGEEPEIQALKGHQDAIWRLGFLDGSKLLWSLAVDGTLKVWATHGGENQSPIEIGDPDGIPITAAASGGDGSALLIGFGDGRVEIASASAPSQREPIQGTDSVGAITTIATCGAKPSFDVALGTSEGRVTWMQCGGDLTCTLQANAEVSSVASIGQVRFGSCEHRKLYTAAGTELSLWRSEEGTQSPRQLWRIFRDAEATDLAPSPSGRWIAVTRKDGTLAVLNSANGQPELEAEVQPAGSPANTLAWRSTEGAEEGDTETLAVGGDSPDISLWAVAPRLDKWIIDRGRIRVERLSLDPEGKRLLVAGHDGIVRMIRLEDGHSRDFVPGPPCVDKQTTGPIDPTLGAEAWAMNASFNAEGTRVLAPIGRRAYLWDAYTGTCLWASPELKPPLHVADAVFRAGGPEVVLTLRCDKSRSRNCEGDGWQLWDRNKQPMAPLRSREIGQPGRVMVSRDGTRTVIRHPHRASVHYLATGTYWTNLSTTTAVSFIPGSPDLLTGRANGSVQRVNFRGRILKAFNGASDEGYVRDLAVDPNGRLAAGVYLDGSTRVWSLESGEQAVTLETSESGGDGGWERVLWSPKGRIMAAASAHGTVQLWDVRTGETLERFGLGDRLVRDLVFTPDGRRLIAADWEGKVVAWRLPSAIESEAAPRSTLLKTLDRWQTQLGVSIGKGFQGDGDLSLAYKEIHGAVDLGMGEAGPGAIDKRERIFDALKRDDLFHAAHLLSQRTNESDRLRAWVRSQVDKALSGVEWRSDANGDTLIVTFSPSGSLLATVSSQGHATLWDATSGQVRHTLDHDGSEVRLIRFSPERNLVATSDMTPVIRIWDSRTGQLLHKLAGHAHDVNDFRFGSDGSRLISDSDDGTARVWDTATGESITILHNPEFDTSIADALLTPDGRFALTRGNQRPTELWALPEGTKVNQLSDPSEPDSMLKTRAFCLHPSGKRLATTHEGDITRVWSLPDLGLQATLEGLDPDIRPVACRFDPKDQEILFVTSSAGRLVQWRINAGGQQSHRQQILQHPHPTDIGGNFRISKDGRTLLSSAHQVARIWTGLPWTLRQELPSHGDSLMGLAIDPTDSNRVATLSRRGDLVLWNLEKRSPWRPAVYLPARVDQVAPDAAGQTVAAVTKDGRAFWIDFRKPPGNSVRLPVDQQVGAITLSPDGAYLVSSQEIRGDGAVSGDLILWRVEQGTPRLERRFAAGAAIRFLYPSPDLEQLTLLRADGQVERWNALTGQHRWTSKVAEDGAYLPDVTPTPSIAGDWIAVLDSDGAVRLLDGEDGVERWRLAARSAPVSRLRPSPDGALLAVADYDGRVRLLDSRTKVLRRTLYGNPSPVLELSFSADGKRLASRTANRRATVWDLATGNRVRNIEDTAGKTESVAFVGRRGWLAIMDDSTIRLSDADDGTPLMHWPAPNDTRALLAPAGAEAFLSVSDNSIYRYPLPHIKTRSNE